MKREFIIPGLILLFITSFFLSFTTALKVPIMVLLVLFTMSEGSFRHKLILLKERKYVWFMLAFALALLISFLLSDNRSAGIRFLQLRIPLLLFPISLGLFQLDKDQRDRILLGAAVIISIGCLVSVVYAISRYLENNNAAWLYNDALSFFIGQQSIYTSLLVNISIYVFAYHLLYSRFTQTHKILLGIALAFLFVISYLLASRNMMLILYATVILFSFYFIVTKKKWQEGVTLLLGIIIIGGLIFKFFPKTINRFKELTFTQFNFQSRAKESHYAADLTPDQWNGANFRLAAWQCGWQLFKEHPLMGVGLGDKKEELSKVYRQKQFLFAITTKKNVHNNYLDILYSMGVAGLFLFLTGWIIMPFAWLIRNKDGLAIIILVTLSLAMLTENYFDRSLGAMLFSFFTTFLLTTTKKNSQSPGI